MELRSYDAVVVGGGAAGLSAALVLGRARRRLSRGLVLVTWPHRFTRTVPDQ